MQNHFTAQGWPWGLKQDPENTNFKTKIQNLNIHELVLLNKTTVAETKSIFLILLRHDLPLSLSFMLLYLPRLQMTNYKILETIKTDKKSIAKI